MLTGAATVFTVADVAASTAHYRDVLGFAVTFEYGDPVYYVCLCRDEVSLHLIGVGASKRLAGHGAVCVFVRDVDALHGELVARRANVLQPPQDYDYGMRDFTVVDPDGNRVTYGMAIGAES